LFDQVGELRQVLVDFENKLLEQLHSSEGNLLDNTTLFSTLANAETKSQEKKESLANLMQGQSKD
jgi:hypothetical protein